LGLDYKIVSSRILGRVFKPQSELGLDYKIVSSRIPC
ncbi:MAG: hypothetical protein XE03_1407, partial [candidate division TA06 bacterium 34_109]